MKHFHLIKNLDSEHSHLSGRGHHSITRTTRSQSHRRALSERAAINPRTFASQTQGWATIPTLACALTVLTLATLLLSGCNGENGINAQRFTQFTMVMIPAPGAPLDESLSADQLDEFARVVLPANRDFGISKLDDHTGSVSDFLIYSARRNYSLIESSLRRIPRQSRADYVYSDIADSELTLASTVLKFNFVAETDSAFSGSRHKVSVVGSRNDCILKYLQNDFALTDDFCDGDFMGFSFTLSEEEMTKTVQALANSDPFESFELTSLSRNEQPFKIKVHKRLTLAPIFYNPYQMLVVKNVPAVEFLVERNGRWESRAYGLIKRHCHAPVAEENTGCTDLANGSDQAGHLVFTEYHNAFSSTRYSENDDQKFWNLVIPILNLPPQSPLRESLGNYFQQNLTTQAHAARADHVSNPYGDSDFMQQFIGAGLEHHAIIQVAHPAHGRSCIAIADDAPICPETVLEHISETTLESYARESYESALRRELPDSAVSPSPSSTPTNSREIESLIQLIEACTGTKFIRGEMDHGLQNLRSRLEACRIFQRARINRISDPISGSELRLL